MGNELSVDSRFSILFEESWFVDRSKLGHGGKPLCRVVVECNIVAQYY